MDSAEYRTFLLPPTSGFETLCLCSDDKEPSKRLNHFDLRIIEPAERCAGDYLVRCADCALPVGNVEHTIDDRQQRINIVRNQQHGHTTCTEGLRNQPHDFLAS